MKMTETKCMRFGRRAIPIMLCLLMLGLIIAGALTPSEDTRLRFSHMMHATEGWVDLDSGEPVTQNRHRIAEGERWHIGMTLPEDLHDHMWFQLCNPHMYIVVRVGDEVVLESGEASTRLGTESARTYVGFPLSHEYAGKQLTLEIESRSMAYDFDLSLISMGARSDLALMVLNQSGLPIFQSILLLLYSLGLIGYSFSLRPYRIRFGAKCFLLLGVFSLLGATWFLSESYLYQFLFGDSSIRYMSAFFSFLLLPVPLLWLYCEITPHSRRVLCGIRCGYELMIAVGLILYAAGWVHLSRMMTGFHVMMGLVIGSILVACLMERRYFRATYVEGSLIPFVLLAATAGVNMVVYYVYLPEDTLLLFRWGLMAYLLLLSLMVLKRSLVQCREQRIVERYNQMPCGLFYLVLGKDAHGKPVVGGNEFYSFNPACLNLLRYRDPEALEQAMRTSLLSAAEWERFRKNVLNAAWGERVSDQMRMRRGDGTEGVVDIVFERRRFDGEIAVQCVILDMTEVIEAKNKLSLYEQTCRLVIENSNRVVQTISLADGVSLAPKQFSDLLGEPEQMTDLPEGAIRRGSVAPESVEEFRALYRAILEGLPCDGIHRIARITAEGKKIWMDMRYVLLDGADGQPGTAIMYMDDVTDAKQRESALLRMAERDGMTGLLNRKAMEARVREYLSSPRRANSVLLALDMDGLKELNDTYGHAAGDEALIRIAETLEGFFRRTDVIGRIGGDEFMVFLQGCGDDQWLQRTLTRLLAQLNEQRVAEDRVPVRCSIGGAFVRADDTFSSFYGRADECLYRAKSMGKNTFAFVNVDGSLTSGAHE